jgi:uncharacterized membrane protein (UPF0127 family)
MKTILTINGFNFQIEIAATSDEREQGLMFVESLPQNHGLLLDFLEEQEEIIVWMKNVLIPLDLVFLDENLEVCHLVENCTPGSEEHISSTCPARFCLEVNAGIVEACEIDGASFATIRTDLPEETTNHRYSRVFQKAVKRIQESNEDFESGLKWLSLMMEDNPIGSSSSVYGTGQIDTPETPIRSPLKRKALQRVVDKLKAKVANKGPSSSPRSGTTAAPFPTET